MYWHMQSPCQTLLDTCPNIIGYFAKDYWILSHLSLDSCLFLISLDTFLFYKLS